MSVSLTTATAGGLIYYTTDGSDPDVSAALYSSGMPLVFTAEDADRVVSELDVVLSGEAFVDS